MSVRKHRWGLYFAVEDFGRPRPQRTVQDGIDISLLKDIRPVPIESIKLFVTIHGMIADVTCQASFTNTEADHIDGFFLFPVDPEASLYHFESSINGRKIVAAAREKGENHELSLLEELDGEGILLEETSSNMFTCHIGVVPSDEQVDVMFQYSIELDVSPEGDVKFVFPSFVPKELQSRYMDFTYGPGAVDEYSFDFYFQAIVAGNYMIRDVLSREVLEIDYLDQSRYNAKLTLGGSYLPNRDFSFTMKYADIESPHILVQKGGSEAAFDHVVMTNQCGLFTLFHRLNKARPKSTKGEFIFSIDRSPGMRGHKMQLARETLLYFIKGLPMGCYFNIVSFGAEQQSLFKSSRIYNQYNVMKAIKCQLKMRCDMPGQSVIGLLEYVYSQPLIAGHPKQIFILTEGSAHNKHECIEFVNQRSEFARLFTLGIGESCHRAMITGLARAGNGKPHFLKLNEKPYNSVLEVLKQAMQPGLTDLQMEFDTPAGVTCLTIPPMIPPIVFAEEKLQIYILIRGEPEDPRDCECTLTVSGTLGKDEPYSKTIYFNLAESMINENLPIQRLALKTEILDLEKSIATALGADDILENEYCIVQASLAANIPSRFSPLVGIDAMTGQEVEGFPIIRVRSEDIAYGSMRYGGGGGAPSVAGSVYKSVSRLTLSRGENPSQFVRGIFERGSGGQRSGYSMADSRIHDFDDEVEDGLEMEYTFKRPPAAVADLDSELALSEIYMGVSDKDEWDKFKDSLKHPGGLTKFQHPDGYWMLDKKIAYAFGSTITDVKHDNPLRDDVVWTTVLCLNWLKVNYLIRKTEWKESDDWAKAWLYQQDLEDYTLDELLELASELKHLDGHVLFRPPPRPQREISTIDEDEEAPQPSGPVTYMKQESITYVDNDLDNMGEEEYEHDRIADDIKTNAIEISATKRLQETSQQDATKDHPGHLTVVSPSQHQDLPPLPPPEGVRTNRHHHTTVERQMSMRQHGEGHTELMGRYGEVKASVPSTAPYHRRPQPSRRSPSLSPQPSSSDGRALAQSSPHPARESVQILTQQDQNINLSCQPSQHHHNGIQTTAGYPHPNQPDRDENVTTSCYLQQTDPNRASSRQLHRPDTHSQQRDSPQGSYQREHRDPPTPTTRQSLLLEDTTQIHHHRGPHAEQTMTAAHIDGEHTMIPIQSDHRGQPIDQQYQAMPGQWMPPKTQATPQMEAAKPLAHHQQYEGASHCSPLTPQMGKAFQPTAPSRTSLRREQGFQPPPQETPPRENIPSVPISNTNLTDLHPEVRGQLAPRPSELPLRHTTSTDMLMNVESLEEPNYDTHHEEDIPLVSGDRRRSIPNSQSWPVERSESRMSLRSTKSVSFKAPQNQPPNQQHRPGEKGKPKKLSFKQRMKNLKDNLMYAYEIKHCHGDDFQRMNSIRSSIRSGRSPYAIDFDETDELMPASRRPIRKKKKPQQDEQRSRPPVVESRPVTPSAVSRSETPEMTFAAIEPRSRPVTPSRSRPVTPSRSRPASPELVSLAHSQPNSPEFRVRSKTPDFRPRTPAADEMPPPMITDEHATEERNVSAPSSQALIIKPTAGRLVTTQYQESPRSSFRSHHTEL